MDRSIMREYIKGLLDFHTHSIHSDGGDTPTELVKKAKKYGVSALALTDHNIYSGLEEFIYACEQADIFPIPFGVEIFAELPEEIPQEEENKSPDMIILGKNPKKEHFAEYQKFLTKDRQNRWFTERVRKLEENGFTVPFFSRLDVRNVIDPPIFTEFLNNEKNIERLIEHINTYYPDENRSLKKEKILENPGYYANTFLYAPGRRCYAQTIKGFSVANAKDLSRAINCELGIAHPGGENGLSDRILEHYLQQGVRIIEVRNYFNKQEQNKKFDNLAKEYSLIRSGGSDYHRDNKDRKLGMHDKRQNQLPKDILEELWSSLPA